MAHLTTFWIRETFKRMFLSVIVIKAVVMSTRVNCHTNLIYLCPGFVLNLRQFIKFAV